MEPSFILSANPITPTTVSFRATNTAVFAAACNLFKALSISVDITVVGSKILLLPIKTLLSFKVARTPAPGTALNPIARLSIKPRTVAAPTIACASGCSLLCSIEATNSSKLSSFFMADWSGDIMTSVTVVCPTVIVPVLSRNIVLILAVFSKVSLSRNNIPSSAPRPTPTTIAAGVANPSAQGHAITSTDTMYIIAVVKVTPPNQNQPPKVRIANTITPGTNTDETLST